MADVRYLKFLKLKTPFLRNHSSYFCGHFLTPSTLSSFHFFSEIQDGGLPLFKNFKNLKIATFSQWFKL